MARVDESDQPDKPVCEASLQNIDPTRKEDVQRNPLELKIEESERENPDSQSESAAVCCEMKVKVEEQVREPVAVAVTSLGNAEVAFDEECSVFTEERVRELALI